MKCQFCNRSFKNKGALKSHEKFCSLNPNAPKPVCKYCNQEFSDTKAKGHHEHWCKLNPRYNELHPSSHTDNYITWKDSDFNKSQKLNCQFCNKECHNFNSLRQHECRCKENPNRRDYDKLGKYSSEYNKGQTKETNPSIAKQSKTIKERYDSGTLIPFNKGKPGTFLGKHHTKEQIDKMMQSYHYTLERRGNTYKFGTYKGIQCDSGWELAFVIYCTDRNLPIKRCTESFEYWHPQENRIALYYPDFIIEDVYYEVKGLVNDIVEAKCKAFPTDKVLILLKPENFGYILDYCHHFYGKDFYRMYDRNYPSWMDLEENKNDISNS